jgi:protein TonB
MATLARSPDGAFDEQPSIRLLIAIAMSLLLHLALLIGIRVNPTGGVPQASTVISARLESTPTEPQLLPEAALPEAQQNSPVPVNSVDASVEAPQRKPGPSQETKPRVPPPPSTPSSGVEMALIRDPTFYPASQLDVYPQPLAPLQLPYPEGAVMERVEGSVLLLLLIDDFGMVSDVSVVDAQPAGYFEEAARAAFRAVRFSAGMRQGHPVKSRIQFRVRYTYDSAAEAAR